VRDGRIIGLLAVHDTRGPREWTDAEVAAVGEAARRVSVEVAELDV
jgi:GAF domain-containing protein